jgi:hypothetical protein
VTEDQDKDRERLDRYIARAGLVSAMNNTKWRAAIGALTSIPDFHPRFRVRCLRDPDTSEPRWDASFPWHVPTFVWIEWLEVDPVVVTQHHGQDFTGLISSALEAVHVPFYIVDGAVRIAGYLRAASTQSR